MKNMVRRWLRRDRTEEGPTSGELPFPPLKYRKLVGPTDPADFDNPSGDRVWGDLVVGPLTPGEAYRSVFDFGCGCGRNARQLLLQRESPERYVGVDVNPDMIRWCQRNLRKAGTDVRFDHHDVWNVTYAPDNSRNETLPIRHYGTDFTLFNAHSLFTHLYERQTEFYLEQAAGMITERGLLRTTWFLFDRAWFPVLAPHQHSLFVNDYDPTQAVYYDWTYVRTLFERLGLKIVQVQWTAMPGYQSEIFLARGSDFEDLAAGLEPPATVLGFGGSGPPAWDGT